MKYINFQKNWNNKLNKLSFTTIRKNCYLKVNETIEVRLKGEPLNIFTVEEIEIKKLSDIDREIIESDTGYEYDKAMVLFSNFGIKADDICYIIYLKALQKRFRST